MTRPIITVFVALLLVFAGCSSPGASAGEDVDDAEETPRDNDAGAEPQNPRNDTSPTAETPENPTETAENETTTTESG